MNAPVSAYSYDEAFSRNLGWVTDAEQQRLRRSRVCIAGLGGVGGIYLLTLARLGIGAFSVADFDRFSLALQEIVNARVWGGIHFRTADVQGVRIGKEVGFWLQKHYFTPLRPSR